MLMGRFVMDSMGGSDLGLGQYARDSFSFRFWDAHAQHMISPFHLVFHFASVENDVAWMDDGLFCFSPHGCGLCCGWQGRHLGSAIMGGSSFGIGAEITFFSPFLLF